MLISIRHSTKYLYDSNAAYSIQSLRLTPPDFDGQKVLNWNVTVPGAQLSQCRQDAFGNQVHLATIAKRHKEVVVEASGRVEAEDRNGIVAGLRSPASPRVFLRETARTEPDAEIRALAESVRCDSVINCLHALSAALRERMTYEVGVTHAHTSAADAWADGEGVCQDYTHVFLAASRHLGVPARYVTGYLVTEEDCVTEAHHAWAETWVDGLGWVGFDVVNAMCPTEHYVRVACGLDAVDAAPVRGSRRGGDGESMDVNVVVEPCRPQPE